MKHLTAIILTVSVFGALPSAAIEADYTGRNYLPPACALFARDAAQAAENFRAGVTLPRLLALIEQVPLSGEERERTFQAIQLVWKHRLDNPVLAYSVAMGLCLKPKEVMAPMDEPWITSPRTSREFF